MKRFRHPFVLLFALAAICIASVTVAGASDDGGPPSSTPPVGSPPPQAGTRANKPASYELSYVAITPCRVLDTRDAGGTMTSTERTFKVSGNLASQGGGPCGIPSSAKAVALNLTAISAGGSTGFVRGRAAGGPTATTSLLNFSPALNASNAVSQPVSSAGMQLRTYGSANLVGDVQGYYAEQIEGMIDPSGSVYNGTSAIVSAVRNSTGNYTVTVDRDVTYCTPTVTAYSGYVYGSAYTFNGNKVSVLIWYLNNSGTATTYDGYFYINVDC
ncbi:hypothetical protein BH10ACT1_BH10ACT1_00230 [soil metagenome]